MSKRNSYSPGKAAKAALGTNGFAPHIPELLESQAWRSRSIHLVRLLDRLEMEHIAHAGKENGYLVVTWDQLVEYGIGRRFIKSAIVEGAHLGLIQVTHQGVGVRRKDPSNYRITYLPAKFVPVTGAPEYHEPTHEWRNYDKTNPKRPAKRSAFVASKIVSRVHHGLLHGFTTGDCHRFTTGAPMEADSEGFRTVTHGELLSTLRSTPHAVFPPGAEPASPGASLSRLERPPPARAGLRSTDPERGRTPMPDEVEKGSTTADSNPDVHGRKPAGGKKRDRGELQREVRKSRFCEVALQRDAEAQRYIEANMDRYGLGGVLERWRAYEQRIVEKYQGPDAECSDRNLDAAWLARDRAHQKARRID